MKRAAVRLSAVTCLGGLFTLTALPVWAAESLCNAQEQVIFSCSLGKKMVSVCASNDFSASSGYLQYRFGQKDALELAFPNLTESAPASQSVQARTLMFAGGGAGVICALSTGNTITLCIPRLVRVGAQKTVLPLRRTTN